MITTEVRGLRSEVRGQRSEVRGQRSGVSKPLNLESRTEVTE